MSLAMVMRESEGNNTCRVRMSEVSVRVIMMMATMVMMSMRVVGK